MQHPFGYFDETGNEPRDEDPDDPGDALPRQVGDGLDGADVRWRFSVDVDESVFIGQVARQQGLPAPLHQIRVFGQGDDAAAREGSRFAWISREPDTVEPCSETSAS